MKQPKVTVIIPTYNRTEYLGTAIQSVFDQTFDDFELIVIDDGSTDDTEDLLRGITESRYRFVRQEHRGISAALNTGIRVARGTYIARLDSDDVWLPDMLAVQAAVLDGRLEVGVVYAKAEGMDQDGESLPLTWGTPERYPGDAFKSMLYDNFTCAVTVVIRRACFDRVGYYDETLQTGEDRDILLRVARRYRFAFVDRVLARFRIHDSNTSWPNSPLFAGAADMELKILDKAFAEPGLPPEILAMKPVCYRNVYTFPVLASVKFRDYKRALGYCWKAIRAGGNPAVTVVRIGWFVLSWGVFYRYEWGRKLVNGQADLRRRLREVRASRHKKWPAPKER